MPRMFHRRLFLFPKHILIYNFTSYYQTITLKWAELKLQIQGCDNLKLKLTCHRSAVKFPAGPDACEAQGQPSSRWCPEFETVWSQWCWLGLGPGTWRMGLHWHAPNFSTTHSKFKGHKKEKKKITDLHKGCKNSSNKVINIIIQAKQ